jgi:hypothetical protein
MSLFQIIPLFYRRELAFPLNSRGEMKATASQDAPCLFFLSMTPLGVLTVEEHLFLCYTFLLFDATFDASLACVIRRRNLGRLSVQVCGARRARVPC